MQSTPNIPKDQQHMHIKALRCISPMYHFAYKKNKPYIAVKQSTVREEEQQHQSTLHARFFFDFRDQIKATSCVFAISKKYSGEGGYRVTTDATLFGQNATSQSLYAAAEADRELANGTLYLDSIKSFHFVSFLCCL
ncbi:hypothetical protein GPALN_013176 [Globodera pallida]|nr:hypothetical protein GPALN_013176 [Globodera pallida]